MRDIDWELIKACKDGDALTVEKLLRRGANPNIQDHNNKTPTIIAAQNGHIPIIALLIEYGADPHATDCDDQNALHYAIEKQHHDIAQYLLTHLQVDPNIQDNLGRTPLMLTAKKGDIKMLQLLIQHGANPYIQDKRGRRAIHYALEYKNHDITQYLLTHLQPDPNSQDKLGITPFLLATKNGDIKMLRLLIQLGANPHTTDDLGRTALHYAIAEKHYDTAKYLLIKLKLDPNATSQQGITPLMIAAQNGDIPMLQLLIQLGANPYATDHDGETALHYAIAEKHYDTAKYLLIKLKLDPNATSQQGITPLMIAAKKGDLNILQLLAQLGAAPNMTDQHGQTALHYALENQYDDIAQYLITQTHINPNIQDQRGYTPFLIATLNGDLNTLHLLVQHGANPYTTDHEGKTALHYALEKQRHYIAQYLLTHLQPDPNAQDKDGITPLILATKNGDLNIIKLLVQHGANPNIQDNLGKTALHYALEKQYRDIAQYLLTHLQPDPNTQDKDGITPLMLAAKNGDIDIIKCLIQLGADPHIQDTSGQCTLHYALEEQHHDIAQYLLTYLQVDPNIQDQWGRTPLMLAAKNGDINMIKLLIQLGANPYATDQHSQTVIHYALKKGHYDIFEYLISDLHLDPNAQDHDGDTPLLIAVEQWYWKKRIANTLNRLGANPYIPNHQGKTPISIARLNRIRLPKPKPSTITL